MAEGKLDLEGFNPGNLSPYYRDALALEVKEGLIDLTTQYRFDAKEDRIRYKVSGSESQIITVRLDLPGHPEPLWRIPSLIIKDGTINVSGKTVVIGAIQGKDGIGHVQRDKDGTLNYARIVKAQSSTAPVKEPIKKDETEWKVEAKQIALDSFKIDIDDRTAANPAKFAFRIYSFASTTFPT